MKLVNIALVALVVSTLVVGCRKQDDDDADEGSLGSSDAQLVEDDAEASGTDDDLEVGLDDPLSGASETDPGSPADGATDAEVLERVRTNPGRFFKPAGCIVSTLEGNKVHHVFNKCRGPYDMAEFNGTITSTYVRELGKLTITHEASGFTANGASINGQRVVVYTRDGSLVTKTRNGSWSGTTAKGKPISHEASFVTTYDAASKCITRDGTAHTTINNRSFDRVIDGYKRCGIGRLGCPASGKVTLTRTRGEDNASLNIEFSGGTRYRVTRPNGTTVTRLLICNPNAG